MIYLSITAYGKKHGQSRQRVQQLIKQGRVPCWTLHKNAVGIPENHPWPKRLKSGRKPNSLREAS